MEREFDPRFRLWLFADKDCEVDDDCPIDGGDYGSYSDAMADLRQMTADEWHILPLSVCRHGVSEYCVGVKVGCPAGSYHQCGAIAVSREHWTAEQATHAARGHVETHNQWLKGESNP